MHDTWVTPRRTAMELGELCGRILAILDGPFGGQLTAEHWQQLSAEAKQLQATIQHTIESEPDTVQ